MDTIVLSTDDLRAIVTNVGLHQLMDEVVEGLEAACLDFCEDELQIPPRVGFEDEKDGLLEWMPVLRTGHRATLKVVGYHPPNSSTRRLPTVLSVGLVFDTDSGHLVCLSDATFTTAIRTGAASAVASRVLAHADSRTLGLVGGGAQALSQLHALSRSFNLKEVLVFDIDQTACATFEQRIRPLQLNGVRVRPATLAEVTTNADILCTATTIGVSAGPAFQDKGLQAHVHVNAVGSDFPGKTELPKAFLKRSFVAVDFLPQAIHEGEAQQLQRHEIGPGLVEMVQGAAQFAAYRSQPTVFDSTGFALEDEVALSVLHQHARRLGVGSAFEIETVSTDPKNPYSFLQTDFSNSIETWASDVGNRAGVQPSVD